MASRIQSERGCVSNLDGDSHQFQCGSEGSNRMVAAVTAITTVITAGGVAYLIGFVSGVLLDIKGE